MKKGKTYSYTVKRISTSPYYSSSFVELEKNTLESIQGIKYLYSESPEESDILITNTHTKIEDISESQLNRCKLIIHPNSGYDNFSFDFTDKALFPIIIGNEIRSHAVANFILANLLTHYSRVPDQKIWHADRKWPRKLLNELNIQIIGDGFISKILQQCLRSLVKNLYVYDPYKDKQTFNLNNIDVLIPVCSLNPTSRYIINHSVLEQLNSDFLLINAARGELVQTEDLVKMLASKPKAFAILDVFEKEPCDFNDFKNLNNLRLSSHIAGVYTNLDQTTCEFEKKIIHDFCQLPACDFEKTHSDSLLKNKIYNNTLI